MQLPQASLLHATSSLTGKPTLLWIDKKKERLFHIHFWLSTWKLHPNGSCSFMLFLTSWRPSSSSMLVAWIPTAYSSLSIRYYFYKGHRQGNDMKQTPFLSFVPFFCSPMTITKSRVGMSDFTEVLEKIKYILIFTFNTVCYKWLFPYSSGSIGRLNPTHRNSLVN